MLECYFSIKIGASEWDLIGFRDGKTNMGGETWDVLVVSSEVYRM